MQITLRRAVATLGTLAVAGGIAIATALTPAAQAGPGGNGNGNGGGGGGGGGCTGTLVGGVCKILTDSTTTTVVSDPVIETTSVPGPSNNDLAASWTDETTTITTDVIKTDTFDTYQGTQNGQYLGEVSVDTTLSSTTDTSTQTLNPGGDAPDGIQGKTFPKRGR